ncbi:MAG: hypothetical protein HY720_09375 [Planctomycetes bacterium]|nr:hypothetical protein [Planctomycetota bacterium]
MRLAPIVLALALLGASLASTALRADELQGRVIEVSGGEVRVTLDSDVVPTPGDRAVVYYQREGSAKRAVVGGGKVARVEGRVVVVTMDDPASEVEVGYRIQVSTAASREVPVAERQEDGDFVVTVEFDREGRRLFYRSYFAHADGIDRVSATEQAADDDYDSAVDAMGEGRLHRITRRGQETVLERIDLSRPDGSTSCRIDWEDATALLPDGDRCFAGGGGRFGEVDFSSEPPVLRVIRRLEPERGPAFILRSGRTVLAVSLYCPDPNSIHPLVQGWAHVFEVGSAGRIDYRYTGALPDLYDTYYTGTIVHKGKLYATTYYYHHGAVNSLKVFDVVGLRGAGPEDRPEVALHEEDEYRAGESPTLLAGDSFTRWGRLAILGEQILIVAGTRGILALRLPVGQLSRANRIDVGGECLDLFVRGERVFALSKTDESVDLVVLSPTGRGESLGIERRVRVEGNPHRFVR